MDQTFHAIRNLLFLSFVFLKEYRFKNKMSAFATDRKTTHSTFDSRKRSFFKKP